MPFKLDIFPPDRMVVAVARGEITLADLMMLVKELIDSGTLPYRKIIDITATPDTVEEMAIVIRLDGSQLARVTRVGKVLLIRWPGINTPPSEATSAESAYRQIIRYAMEITPDVNEDRISELGQ